MAAKDERPSAAIGHVALHVSDVKASIEFMLSLGLRSVFQGPDMGIVELRGGTHLLLFPAEQPVAPGTKAPFDLMVDDVRAARERWTALGIDASAIESNRNHDSFTVREPSGWEITINSSHASDLPV